MPQFIWCFGVSVTVCKSYVIAKVRKSYKPVFASKICWLSLLVESLLWTTVSDACLLWAEWRSRRMFLSKRKPQPFGHHFWKEAIDSLTELFSITYCSFLVVVFFWWKKHHEPFEKSQTSLATTTTISCRRNLSGCRCKCSGSSRVLWLCSGQLGCERGKELRHAWLLDGFYVNVFKHVFRPLILIASERWWSTQVSALKQSFKSSLHMCHPKGDHENLNILFFRWAKQPPISDVISCRLRPFNAAFVHFFAPRYLFFWLQILHGHVIMFHQHNCSKKKQPRIDKKHNKKTRNWNGVALDHKWLFHTNKWLFYTTNAQC